MSYFAVMAESERIGLRELRQHASRYVRRAQAGETIEITKHGHPVAKLVPVVDPDDPLADLIAAGVVRPAEEPGDLLDITPLPYEPGEPSLSEVLRTMREEERY